MLLHPTAGQGVPSAARIRQQGKGFLVLLQTERERETDAPCSPGPPTPLTHPCLHPRQPHLPPLAPSPLPQAQSRGEAEPKPALSWAAALLPDLLRVRVSDWCRQHVRLLPELLWV